MSTASEVLSQSLQVLDLRPGEVVRVRSASEIFATLDERGTLDGLPFMPEMLKYCGRTLPVTQRADKTCAGDGVVRRMHNTVHLEKIRCDGSAHDGCQAACLMFWKEAWLERLENGSVPAPRELDEEEQSYVAGTLLPATRAEAESGAPRYRCQATDIPGASERLRFRQADQYVRDLQNWSLRKIVRGLVIEVFNLWQEFSKKRLPKRLLIAGGNTYPFVKGKLDKGKTPSGKLDLRPGDLVRIKSKEEIVATLDKTNRNRGLSFDGEMSNYCGRTARVRARVNRLIEESTGEMVNIKSDCIILEGIVCAADYHRFCSRAIYPYWREVWLEKISDAPHQNGSSASCAGC
jgi:predicted DNA-binding antitoxin AbrB/MazE fold protein